MTLLLPTTTAAATPTAATATFPSAGPNPATITGRVLGPVTCATAGAPFTDVRPTDQHCDSITWLAGTDITQIADGRYRPAAAVSRAAMTAFLYRIANPGRADPTCTAKPFPDVLVTNPFCGTIAWAKQSGVTTGKADGRFAHADPVRRGEMAIFLARIAATPTTAPTAPAAPTAAPTTAPPASTTVTCPTSPFRDVPATRTGCAAIAWMAATGISTGYTDGSFRPAARVSRAAMAAFLQRLVTRTDAGPNITTDMLGPLTGATVIAYPAADLPATYTQPRGAVYPRTTSTSAGTYTLALPAGSYRICVDGSTVTARVTYLDGCVQGVAWPAGNPSAPPATPVTTVTANSTTAAPPTILPTTGQNRRAAAPTSVPFSTSYRFIDYGTGSAAPLYSACRPIHYVTRPDNAPPNGTELIEQAIARVAQATGLRFIDDGPTTERPVDRQRAVYQPSRYDAQYAPVLIGWSHEVENPRLGGDVVGFGGSQVAYGRTSTNAITPALVTGTVVLDAPDLTAIMTGYGSWGVALTRAVIMHELAHLVGLDHVDDEGQLLYPYAAALTDFGPGDLAGLAQAGGGPCVTLPNPAATSRYVRIPADPDTWLRN